MNYEEANGIVWRKQLTNSDTENHMNLNSPKMNKDEPKIIHNDQEDDDNDEEDDESDDGLLNINDDEIELNDLDVWDDSILIQMYEQSQKEIAKALKKKYSKEAAENNNDNQGKSDNQTQHQPSNSTSNKKKAKNKKSAGNNKQSITWKQGDYCRLIYNEDGKEYEAQIIEINQPRNQCFIRYIGYENEEWRTINDLKKSNGNDSRESQIQMAIQDGYFGGSSNEVTIDDPIENAKVPSNDQNESQQSTKEMNSNRIIPPPPPFFGLNHQSNVIDDEEETLASMLMSWYMTGYHTGYFQAQRDMQRKLSSNFLNRK